MKNYPQQSLETYWTSHNCPIFKMANCHLVCSGINSPWLNGVFAAHIDWISVPTAVKTVVDYFKARNTPFHWWIEDILEPKNLEGELKKYGGECHGKFDGMVLDFHELKKPESKAGFTIEPVCNPEQMKAFVDVIIGAYGAGPEIQTSMCDFLSKSHDHFLGKENGVPVSVATVCIEGDTGYVYHVGTVPHACRKGYGSLLMHAALDYARQKGCVRSSLVSTPAGQNVYRRLGYRTTHHFRFFTVC